MPLALSHKQPWPVALMWYVPRDFGVDSTDEIDVEVPIRIRGSLPREFIGRLEVQRAALFHVPHISWVEIQSTLGFFFGERTTLDAVGAENAGNYHLFLQLVSNLCQGRAAQAMMGIVHPQVEGFDCVGIGPDL